MASSKQWDSSKKHGKVVQKTNAELSLQKQAVKVLKNTLNATGIRDNEVNVKLQNLQDDSNKCK